MNELEKKHLENMGKTKRIVVILVTWKSSLYSNLENFHKPDDSALIGLFAEQKKKDFPDGVEKFFDEIFWYRADYRGAENLYSDLKEIDILRKFSEKSTTFQVCIRTNCKDPFLGPSYTDIEPLRNKALIKQIAEENAIPSVKFAIVDFSKNFNLTQDIEMIISKIGKFPMFCKPILGVGCGGSATINDKEELRKWLENMMEEEGKNRVYLIEEFVFGLEFNAAVCLLQDGSWRPLMITSFPEKGKERVLKNSEPYTILGGRFEDCTDSFPNMEKFVKKVIDVYKPSHPHLFTVQGFQLEKNSDNYFLTELSYRNQGQRGTLLSYMYCGVGQETALLCHLDPNYKANLDPKQPSIYERHVWFPYKEGVLRSHRGVEDTAPISSVLEFRWLVEPGTKLCKPQSYAHFLMCIKIRHTDKNVLMKDLKWIEENWYPDIVPIENQ